MKILAWFPRWLVWGLGLGMLSPVWIVASDQPAADPAPRERPVMPFPPWFPWSLPPGFPGPEVVLRNMPGPPLAMWEDDAHTHLEMNIPRGLEASDLRITAQGRQLTIRDKGRTSVRYSFALTLDEPIRGPMEYSVRDTVLHLSWPKDSGSGARDADVRPK